MIHETSRPVMRKQDDSRPVSGPSAEIAELRRIVDLQERAQRLGKTGYVISDLATDRVTWSASLFEQRKVKPRPYFTRAEALSFIHPDDRPHYLDARDKAVAGKRDFDIEVRIVCGDGTEIWERGTLRPEYDTAGTCTGLMCVVHDVTDSKQVFARLYEHEVRYRTLFNSIGDAIVVVSDGLFVDCNQAALRMFGATRDDLIGKSPVEFSPDRQADGKLSAESAADKIAAALCGTRVTFDWRHTRRNGHEFDAEVTLAKGEADGGAFLFGVVRDVTNRRRAELALKEAHDKFAGAFRSSVDAMLVTSIGSETGGGTILDANDAVLNVFGRAPGDLIGKSVGDAFTLLGSEQVAEVRRQLIAGEVLRGLPLKLLRPDGSVADLELNGSTFSLAGDIFCLAIIRDMTERYTAERRIQELNDSLEASLRQLRAIADNLPVAISYQDPSGSFRFTNRTLEQWFAAGPGELIGKRVNEVVSRDYLAATRPVGRRRDAGELKSESTVHYPDGQTRTVEISFIPDMGKDGTLAGWYTLVVDMSERKAAEEQLHQSQRLQSIGKLTGGVAHDFNNLLGVISGNLELVHEKLRRREDRDIARLLEPAQRAAERGSTLTKSLLSFARQQPLSPQVVDVSMLVSDMVRLLRRTLPANISVHLEGFSSPVRCEVDPGQLQNALLNLVVNARDAMPKGGSLTIERQTVRSDDTSNAEMAPGEYVTLSVSDTGSGMPADVVSRAFEPFFTTKAVGEGTGLGLSMVYGFAKQSGGNVTLESAPGRGTNVCISLPKWSGTKPKAAPTPVETEMAAPTGKILVVEDDVDMRFITVTMLKSLGYDVVEASDGRAALGVIKKEPSIALIVTDLMLAGGLNGRNVADAAKTLLPEVKTVFMSGYSENTILHEGRLDPGLHFIQKPFRKQELALKVRQALGAD